MALTFLHVPCKMVNERKKTLRHPIRQTEQASFLSRPSQTPQESPTKWPGPLRGFEHPFSVSWTHKVNQGSVVDKSMKKLLFGARRPAHVGIGRRSVRVLVQSKLPEQSAQSMALCWVSSLVPCWRHPSSTDYPIGSKMLRARRRSRATDSCKPRRPKAENEGSHLLVTGQKARSFWVASDKNTQPTKHKNSKKN